jgi:hypothetical protein
VFFAELGFVLGQGAVQVEGHQLDVFAAEVKIIQPQLRVTSYQLQVIKHVVTRSG